MKKYSKQKIHGVYLDNNVLRFKKNECMCYLCDRIDLNKMWIDFYKGTFTKKEFMQFYRDIGYSLSGYLDIWLDK